MIFEWLADALISIARGVVSVLPEYDFAPVLAHVAPARRLVCWFVQLNAGLPVAEAIAAVGLYFSLVAALWVVTLVRRAFSLLWPGAGS